MHTTDANPPKDAPHDDGGRRGLSLEVCLTAIAGYVDATAFVNFGGVFVSFMGGNSTRLAALPALGRSGAAAVAASAVALFVMGAFAGRLMHEAAGAWRRPVLLSVTAALLMLAIVSGDFAAASGAAAPLGFALASMAMSMGVLNAVLKRVGSAEVAATYVTGVLVRFAHALADAAMGRQAPWATYLLSWLGLVFGAAVGGALSARFGISALVLPTALTALLAIVQGGLVRRDPVTRSSR